MSDVAAFAAWIGGAVIVLADARRGLAAGLALIAIAAAGLTWAAGDIAGGIVLLAGGLLAAALRFRIGPDGWGLMQPGSTPRLLFTVIAGLVVLWIAVAVTSGASSGGLRFGAVAILVLLTGRLLQGGAPVALLTATSGLALALGVVSGPLEPGGGIAYYVIAVLVAAGVSAMPASPPQPSGT